MVVELFEESEGLVASARALARLRHPNLVAVRDVVVEEGIVAVESDFVDGEWLADLLEPPDGGARSARLPLGAQLRVLLDVLAGLSALHGARGALPATGTEAAVRDPLHHVHGEIAPANVLVGADGVARLAHSLRAAGATPSPGVMGHLAPEVLLHDQSADERADVFSVGVLLWEALTGKRLHTTAHAGEIVVRLLGGKVQPAEAPKDAPWAQPLVDVAKRALSLELSARYATAHEMAGAVRRIAGGKIGASTELRALVTSLAGARVRARASQGTWAAPLSTAPAPASDAPLAAEVAALDDADLVSDDLVIESDRPTAIPAAAPSDASKLPPIPSMFLPTPIVPMAAVTAFARASARSAPEHVAPPAPPPPRPPPPLPSSPALVAPVAMESIPIDKATDAPLTLNPPGDSEAPRPAARRRGGLLAIIGAAALAVVLAISWATRETDRVTPSATRPSTASQPEAVDPRRAPLPTEPTAPASPEPAPIVAAPSPVGSGADASAPSVEAAESRAPAAAPAAAAPTGSTEAVAPPPLRKKSKTSYYPLGI